MTYKVEKQIREIGLVPYSQPKYNQIHPHSTGNPNSTEQNEADYMSRKDLNTGYYTHVVGGGRVIQTAHVNRGCYDVGGSWNKETYAAIELKESHKTKEEFLIDYEIYVELIRDLAKENDIPRTLDDPGVPGIKTHEYCTYNQPENESDHIDPYPYLNKWGISRERFKKDIENGMTIERVETYENPIKAAIDLVNLNSQAFHVKGWLLHKKNDLKNTVPWLFFIDEKNKELYRVKGKWTSRPDVAAVFPNPQKENVGVEFSGTTPKVLNEGQKYRIMLRASDDKGNVSYAENWFDSNFAQNPKVDTGNLDLFKLENGKLRAAGWHLASNQKQGDYHYLFIMDRKTNKEITRYDITANSYQKSDDVKKTFNNNQLAQGSKCRFDASVDVKDVLKNKNVYVMSRYCYDPLGNDGLSGQYSFKDTVIFI